MNIYTLISANDAAILLAGFGALIPFVIAWLPTIKIPDFAKFGILVALSALGGFLTIVSTNQFITGGTLIQNAAIVLSAAQLFYYGAFRLLGLERVLFPQQALATQVKEQAKDSTPVVSTTTAKDILDPTTQQAVEVTTKVVNS